MGTDDLNKKIDELRDEIQILKDRLATPLPVEKEEDTTTKLQLQLEALQKETQFIRELDEFRTSEFQPFRSSVEVELHQFKWTWAAMGVAIPVLGAILAFLGWSSMGELISKRNQPRLDYAFNLSTGLGLAAHEESAREAIPYLREAFEQAPDSEKRNDDALVAALFRALDNAGMYVEGGDIFKRIESQYHDRYKRLVTSDSYNNMGAILLGRAMETSDSKVLDDAISLLKTSIVLANRPEDKWYANMNLWVCYLLKANLDKDRASDLDIASGYLETLYILPNTPRLEWQNWEVIKNNFWFSKLIREKPSIAEDAKAMMEKHASGQSGNKKTTKASG